jgi:hypothetical protein
LYYSAQNNLNNREVDDKNKKEKLQDYFKKYDPNKLNEITP